MVAHRLAVVVGLFALVVGPLAAQEHEDHEPLTRHQIGLFTGYTWVPRGQREAEDGESTVIAPTFGVDYAFWISHKVGVGLHNDLEFMRYVVETSSGTLVPREYSYVGTIVGIYEAARGLELYAGPGVELEKHENFFVLKLGLGYAFAVADNWATGLTVGYDFKEEYDAWTLGLSVARRF